ncbi:MAG: hypothetical protein CMN77_07130 [Spirochaetaceae bacterium]|nr:hypothetical protein [Spirochaetaceae bacterium]
MTTVLYAQSEFRVRNRIFSNTRLGPVLAQAAYMQTYEYHIQDPVFQTDFDELNLWISFRGDLRFFAVFHKNQLLVAGVRSHRPDALVFENPGLLREFVAFDINLEERFYRETFYLFENTRTGSSETAALEKDRCSGNSHWKPPADETEVSERPESPDPKLQTTEVKSGCQLPLTLEHWLEFIRKSRIPSRTLEKTATPA